MCKKQEIRSGFQYIKYIYITQYQHSKSLYHIDSNNMKKNDSTTNECISKSPTKNVSLSFCKCTNRNKKNCYIGYKRFVIKL